MSVSIGVITAAIMFLAVGEETNLGLLMDWSLEMGSGGCRGQEAYRKHTRLIDAEACVSKLFDPPSSLDEDEDEDAPIVAERGEKLEEPVWVLADQPTPHRNNVGQWIKLRL